MNYRKPITRIKHDIIWGIQAFYNDSMWLLGKAGRFLRGKRRFHIFLFFVVMAVTWLLFNLYQAHRAASMERQNYQVQLENRGKALKAVTSHLQAVEQQKAVTDTQLQQKAAEEASLKAQIENLNQQLQTKREQQKADQVEAASISSVVDGCGDNVYAHYVYMHESGCNTAAVNSIGCRGIGQACPGNKLPCSNTDYACQNAFFTSYANSRYGGWAGAYQAWLSKHWW